MTLGEGDQVRARFLGCAKALAQPGKRPILEGDDHRHAGSLTAATVNFRWLHRARRKVAHALCNRKMAEPKRKVAAPFGTATRFA